MELRHVRYFLAVAEEGSFTRAAARVGIGQPPLSLQIKDLEAEIGAQLFHRLSHGAELTEAGRAFRAAVEGMPGQAVAAIHAARRAARGETGSLGLGCIGSAAINPVVSAAIRRFRRAWPEVELRLQEATSATLCDAVRDGRLDAAVMRPGASDARDLRLHVVAEDALVAALPAGHPLAKTEGPIELADLCDDAFVVTPREIGAGLHDAVLGACRAAGFEPRLGQSAPQIATLLALVAAEFGVSLVAASMRQFGVSGVAFVPLSDATPPLALSLGIRRDERKALVRNFVAEARAAAREAGAADRPMPAPRSRR